jgi:hypothetical protein
MDQISVKLTVTFYENGKRRSVSVESGGNTDEYHKFSDAMARVQHLALEIESDLRKYLGVDNGNS